MGTKDCLQCNSMHRWRTWNFNSSEDHLESTKCKRSQVHVCNWSDDHDGTTCCHQDRELPLPYLCHSSRWQLGGEHLGWRLLPVHRLHSSKRGRFDGLEV